jgi:hypothetical protein
MYQMFSHFSKQSIVIMLRAKINQQKQESILASHLSVPKLWWHFYSLTAGHILSEVPFVRPKAAGLSSLWNASRSHICPLQESGRSLSCPSQGATWRQRLWTGTALTSSPHLQVTRGSGAPPFVRGMYLFSPQLGLFSSWHDNLKTKAMEIRNQSALTSAL